MTVAVRQLLWLLVFLTLSACAMRAPTPTPSTTEVGRATRKPNATQNTSAGEASGSAIPGNGESFDASATAGRTVATSTATSRSSPPATARDAPTATKVAPRATKVRPRTAPVEKSVTLASARRGIENTVDQYYEALDTKDARLFRSTIAHDNPYWQVVQEEQYDLWLVNYADGDASARVREVRPLRGGYYTGKIDLTLHFDENEYGRATQDWVFRRVGGRWKLAEPTRQELGALRVIRGARVTLEYYSWDASQAERVLRLAESASRTVSDRVGIRARQRVRVRLLPAYEVSPGLAAGESVGYYRSASPNTLFLRSPGSFGFGTYRPYGSPYDELTKTATHELTHLLADRRVSLGELPDWMTEGLAEWVSANPRPHEIVRALQKDNLYTLRQLASFERLPGGAGLAYAESYEIVSYVIQKHGLDGYWRLAGAFRERGTLDGALRKALGVGRPEFERDWRRNLRAKYQTDSVP